MSMAQKTWASKHGYAGNEDDHSYDCDYDPLHQYYANSFNEQGPFDDDDNHRTILYSENAFTAFPTYRFRDKYGTHAYHAQTVTPDDCDCGKPQIKVGGKHTCRYFGTFECSCGNQWTSAYCWKGEMQACRSCKLESTPSYPKG